jgi:hypothetical protein
MKVSPGGGLALPEAGSGEAATVPSVCVLFNTEHGFPFLNAPLQALRKGELKRAIGTFLLVGGGWVVGSSFTSTREELLDPKTSQKRDQTTATVQRPATELWTLLLSAGEGGDASGVGARMGYEG